MIIILLLIQGRIEKIPPPFFLVVDGEEKKGKEGRKEGWGFHHNIPVFQLLF